jgi:hypothetical protein
MRTPTARARSAPARLLTALLTLVAVGATAPTALAAGDLHIFAGRLPDGSGAIIGPWSGINLGAPGGTGNFGISMGAVSQGGAIGASLAPPPQLSIALATADRGFNAPVGGNHSQPQITTTWENRGWPFTGRSGSGGFLGDSGSGTVAVANPSILTMQAACVNFDGIAGSCGGASYEISRLDLVLHDADPPTVTGSLTGTLLDDGWHTRPVASARIVAADVGSGAYRAWIREGTHTTYTLLDSDSPRCRDVFPGDASPYEFQPSALTLVPCATAATQYDLTFDLSALGDGVHTVSIGIEDAGGNERTLLTNQTLRINAPGGALGDPGTPCSGGTYDDAGVCHVPTPSGGSSGSSGAGSPSGGGGGGTGASGGVTPAPAQTAAPAPAAPLAASPDPAPATAAPAAPQTLRAGNGERATTAADLALRVGGAVRSRVSVAYGRSVVIEGKLTTPDGDPIAGASVDVMTSTGGATKHEASVITSSDGAFHTVLGRGASRTVRFAYRAFGSDAEYADSSEVRVDVRTGAHLRVTPTRLRNHQAIAFHGTVAGAPGGARKVLEMQVRQAGRWLTFATTRLRKGHFTDRYRFTRTLQPTTYRFRAVVRSESGWPYATGASNSVSVRVRP